MSSTDTERWIEQARADLNTEYQDVVAEQIADALDADRVCEVDYQPGDGTRYPLVFAPMREATRIGAWPALPGQPGNGRRQYAIGVTLVAMADSTGKGYGFNLEHGRRFDYVYVSEKLGHETASALAIADLFTAICKARRP